LLGRIGKVRTILSLVAALTALLFGTMAQAEQLTGTGGNCVGGVADVRTWRPEHGPAAAFIANAYTSAEGTLFIGLGFDAQGFWSVEDHSGSDAGEGPGVLYLAHTSFKGVRTLHKVYDGTEHASFEEVRQPDDTVEQTMARLHDAQRAAIKKRLFTLAAGPWKVKSLSHDYRLGTPKRNEEGSIETFTGWFAEAAMHGKPTLRFGIVGEPFMCWCDYGWRGYTLAAPKKAKR
jgi:hypothetical protein